MTHVLIVDDEAPFRTSLHKALKSRGYRVTSIEDPDAIVATIAIHRPDIVLLDLMFANGVSGLDMCKKLRTWSTIPVIVISVCDDTQTKVQVMDAGADDYVVKPFELDELLARARAIQRRMQRPPGVLVPTLKLGALTIDLDARAVMLNDEYIHLTRNEYGILRALVLAQGKTVTYGMLAENVLRAEGKGDFGNVRTTVKRLRRKLGEDLTSPIYVLTESGVGYRLKHDAANCNH